MPDSKHVTLLALQDGVISTLVGPLDVFTFAGRGWNQLLNQPEQICFKVRVVSVDGKSVRSLNGLKVDVDKAMGEIVKTDLIVVTSGGANLHQHLESYGAIIPWLRGHYERGSIIAGVCSGSMLLAEAGLLDGLKATTHWGIADNFRALYPKVQLVPEALCVDEGQIVTAGGANAATDLALHLVRRLCGESVALECARALLLDLNRQNQACFAPFLHHRRHGDEVVGHVQDWLESHYQKNVNLDELAQRHHMSTRNFKRRFKKATGESPLAYLQKLRMSVARSQLSKTDHTVEQIAHRVGYEDVVFFRRLFKREYGLTPGSYREKFARVH